MSTGSSSTNPHPVRRPRRALALFFLAPLVAEFLLGNLPVTFLPALILLAPLYGGGALLIRETARRRGLAWPGIVILGLAFGVFEEVFTTQSLFNPNYLGLRLLDYGFIPVLGLGAWWTVFVLSLHMIWSTCVPIALMETLTPGQRRTPWLGPTGLAVTTVIFLLGSAVLLRMELKKGFIASPLQFAASTVVIVILIVVAFAVGRPRAAAAPPPIARAPAPLVVGIVAFLTGGLFYLLTFVKSRLPAAVDASAIVLLLAAAAALNLRWSRRAGWNERHRLALTAGFLLTYAWYGFVQVPSVGHVSPLVDALGNTLFAAGALALLAKALSQVKKESP